MTNKMKHYPIRQSITDRSSISVDLYLKDISKFPMLTEEEEKELSSKIKTDPKAKQKLIESNLRFVVSIAKQYQGKGIELCDLISAGNMGLMEAADRFDPDQGCRFLSYSVWWIRDYILRELLQNRSAIRLPVSKITTINKVNKYITDIEKRTGETPSIFQIADALNISDDEVVESLSYNNLIVDSSAQSDKNEEVSIFDTLVFDDNAQKDFEFDSNKIDIITILKRNLTRIEYEVITKFFGFKGDKMSFEEISISMNITRERVRQIKDKAISKLRKSPDFEYLTNFL